MIPDSLINFIISRDYDTWPSFLPIIVSDLDDENHRIWDSDIHITCILSSSLTLSAENQNLDTILRGEGFELVTLFTHLRGLEISEENNSHFHNLTSSNLNPNDELRKIMLEFIFKRSDIFSEDIIRTHIDNFPQRRKIYPVFAETIFPLSKTILLDSAEEDFSPQLVLVSKPLEHWKYARVNILQEGGKIWFPTHQRMKSKSSAKNTFPPPYQDVSNSLSSMYGFLPNDPSSPLTRIRGGNGELVSGPNVIHWDHDFYDSRISQAFNYAVDYLRRSDFAEQRERIRLGIKEPDMIMGGLRILGSDHVKDVIEMISEEKAFKIPGMLNTSYMERNSLIKEGYEDEDGQKYPIHNFTNDPYAAGSQHYHFLEHTLYEDMEKWLKHLFNWDLEDDKPREERGKAIGSVDSIWEARLNDEGKSDRFNYSVLVRDIRLDDTLLEMALQDPYFLPLALEINYLETSISRINGGLRIFEGYWSKLPRTTMGRVLRFDNIPQISRSGGFNTAPRYVAGEPRIATTHPHFTSWKNKNLLGFSRKSSHDSLSFNTNKTRNIVQLLPTNWLPCFNPTQEYKDLIESEGITAINVNEDVFSWLIGFQVPSTVESPWKTRLTKLCELTVSNNVDDSEKMILLDQINKIASEIKNSDSIIRTKLRNLDNTLIENYDEINRICGSGTGLTLANCLQDIQLRDMSFEEIQQSLRNVSLCNWIYNQTDHHFIPCSRSGIENRQIYLISPDRAKEIFGMGNEINCFHASQNSWKSKGFGLKDGSELLILPSTIINMLIPTGYGTQSFTNLTKIPEPNLSALREKNLEMNNDDRPKFNFLDSILTIDSLELFSIDNPNINEMSDEFRNRSSCQLINSDNAIATAALQDDILQVGPGGWIFIEHDNQYNLIHGKMPDLTWSLALLKKLLIKAEISSQILGISTLSSTESRRNQSLKNLISSYIADPRYFITNFLQINSIQALFTHNNPWSSSPSEERENYLTMYTLRQPLVELQNIAQWKTSASALDFLQAKKDSYKLILDSSDRNLDIIASRGTIEDMYRGRFCILDGSQNLTTHSDSYSDSYSPTHKVQISEHLISARRGEVIDLIQRIGEDLLADTLIASPTAASKLNRTIDQDRLDLVDDFLDRMEEIVASQHWDRSPTWVFTPSVLRSPTDDYTGFWLHKLHHLHIVALYSSVRELM